MNAGMRTTPTSRPLTRPSPRPKQSATTSPCTSPPSRPIDADHRHGNHRHAEPGGEVDAAGEQDHHRAQRQDRDRRSLDDHFLEVRQVHDARLDDRDDREDDQEQRERRGGHNDPLNGQPSGGRHAATPSRPNA